MRSHRRAVPKGEEGWSCLRPATPGRWLQSLTKLRSPTVCMNRHIAARGIHGPARASCGFKPCPYMIRKRPIVKAGTSVLAYFPPQDSRSPSSTTSSQSPWPVPRLQHRSSPPSQSSSRVHSQSNVGVVVGGGELVAIRAGWAAFDRPFMVRNPRQSGRTAGEVGRCRGLDTEERPHCNISNLGSWLVMERS